MTDWFPERLRTLRAASGFTQDELAERAQIARTTLIELESGRNVRPQVLTCKKLAAAMGIPVDRLLSEVDTPTATLSGGSHKPLSPGWELLSEQQQTAAAEFDRATNPAVSALRATNPEKYAVFTETDWKELASTVGVGGALTAAGVDAIAERMLQDREVLRRLKVILQTHLGNAARQVVDALYQQVMASPMTLAPAATGSAASQVGESASGPAQAAVVFPMPKALRTGG